MGLRGAAAARSIARESPSEELPDLGPAVERLQPWSKLALVHGAYLVLVGAWPLLHHESFEKFTGPKPGRWLSNGFGAALANIGVQLIQSALRGGRVRREVRSLAVRMGITMAALDFYCARIRRRTSPANLANGAIQLLFVALWGAERIAERRELRRPPVAAHA